MSWSLNLAGKSSKLAEVIKDKFASTQGKARSQSCKFEFVTHGNFVE